MIKPLLITLLLVIITPVISTAQTVSKDSIQHIARIDASTFKLTGAQFKEFRKNKKNGRSDYFKPVKANVSNPAYLNDSVYVAEYRYAAYTKTLKRRTVGHYLLLAGAIGVGIYTIIDLVAIRNQLPTSFK